MSVPFCPACAGEPDDACTACGRMAIDPQTDWDSTEDYVDEAREVRLPELERAELGLPFISTRSKRPNQE